MPSYDNNAVYVVRASTGEKIAVLTGNGLNGPPYAAFDGERVLVTKVNGHSVSLWKATDLTPLSGGLIAPSGNFEQPTNVCSDGLSFWISFAATNQVVRF